MHITSGANDSNESFSREIQRGRARMLIAIVGLAAVLAAPAHAIGEGHEEPWATPSTCTYDTYRWNVNQRSATARERVEKPYSQLGPEELDAASGCSVCVEDQAEIRLEGIVPFRLCRKVAPKVEALLWELQSHGVAIRSLTGYRVGLTRGDVDSEGNRTKFSNHSFGIALDINASANGLYESCYTVGPGCRLRMGGEWDPRGNPLSMTAQHPVVVGMKRIGFRWGGELEGLQKDFMHFSLAGD
ncbi:MAG: hypothetical protein CVV05_08805 [Gammaproteobacteria bacterium HGW-Gammaproteobacteria-1]|jgi:hypothetical protein|nr:MAG: hypothetical protein CVV05_08805 [Gammaproteobacteria bacterium HGW-Gammaproteobacteria-1]